MQKCKKAAYACALGMLIGYLAFVLFTVNAHFSEHINFAQFQLAD
jgi:hypothetical protein